MSKKYTGQYSWKATEEWIGDAALLYLARKDLTVRYSSLPIKLIDQRVNLIVANNNLTGYAKRHKMPFACNMIERIIGKMMEDSPFKARVLVKKIIDECEALKQLDKQQLDAHGQPKSLGILKYWNHKANPQRGDAGILKIGTKYFEIPSLVLVNP